MMRLMQMMRGDKGSKGFILITSYMMIAVISIFSLALSARNSMFIQASERNQNKILSFNMAESALDLAIAQLADDPNYVGTGGYVSMSTNSVQAGYSVNVCPPACGANPQPTDPDVRLIDAVGFAPGNVTYERAYESRSILAYVNMPPTGLFNFAVFADESMQINGNPLIDSYNSSDGAYNAGDANENGDIGTNSVLASTVDIIGNATIKGDAAVGPGGVPASVIDTGPNTTITGAQGNNPSFINYTAPTVPGGATNLGNLKIKGNTNYLLPAGTYHLSSLSVSGNGTLTAQGPVSIYVDGSVSIAGNGVATSSNLPPNFLVYVTGNSDVSIGGNGNFYGAIYAPNSHVSNGGNGDVFGAVISNTYHQNGNGDVHFDEALSEIPGGSGTDVNLIAWVEKNTTAGS